MRLLFIRHGEPDYERDSLTEKGWKEAELLSQRLSKLEVAQFYVSSLGRARDTASLTLRKMGRTAIKCEWLREFWPRIKRPDMVGKRDTLAWDWLPEDWTAEENYFRRDGWLDTDIMRQGGVGEAYEEVIRNFDALLAGHGYVREGNLYRVERANQDTIVFFSHFGLECVLLSRLMNTSPMILWHHLCAAPSSVTTVYTEERCPGKAIFRVSAFGDISHLYVAEEEPSFSARFCETYDSQGERHG